MKKILLSDVPENAFKFVNPHEYFSCDSCGRKLMYFTDLEEGEYYGRCPNCGHVKHVSIKRKEV